MAKSSIVLLGPWGGEGGSPWSHTLIGEISNIFISHDRNGVNSVRFVSKNGTHDSGVIGVANGTEKEIKIDSKVEKLISIDGSVGIFNSVKRVTSLGFTTKRVTSLGFITSKTIHAPVGTGKRDSEFSCLLSEDPIVGFHGRSGAVLNSIGISTEIKTRELVGPWPAPSGGGPWEYTSVGPISLISVTYDDDIVRSLQFGSRGADGVLIKSNIFGKADGSKTSEVEIDTKVLKIIGIKGAYGTYAGATLVKSVTFITNNFRSIGPFGAQKDEDKPFSYSVKGDEVITGFHGQAGSLIDSIGVYIQPSKSSIKVGPFKASGSGTAWDYKPKGSLSRIIVTYQGALDTYQFESIDENGIKLISSIFGSAPRVDKYTIDMGKDDKLTGISGTVSPYSGTVFITGMYFYTQKKNEYGPFGVGGKGLASKFSFQVKNGYISGFYGSSTFGSHAIGIYVKPTN